MEQLERRSFEFRAGGDGAIEGTVIPYGQSARIGDFTEKFLAGSINFSDVIANRQHQRSAPLARTNGGGLTLTDSASALRARIELPDTADGRDTRELVKRGILRGLSAEFRAIRDTWEASERTIQEAVLSGLAVVDSGAYAGATLTEVRELETFLQAGCLRNQSNQRGIIRIWPSL